MSSDVVLDGTQYVLSREAAKRTGYAQDYIGQLARKGLIDARRIGGLWYVSTESIDAYKRKEEGDTTHASGANVMSPSAKEVLRPQDADSLVFLDGQELISASRASTLTGYSQDYVGQLARSGKILSRQVGNRWYVEQAALLGHKKEKDALLAAVQSESVGISRMNTKSSEESERVAEEPLRTHFVYNSEDKRLTPSIGTRFEEIEPAQRTEVSHAGLPPEEAQEIRAIPIRVLQSKTTDTQRVADSHKKDSPDSRGNILRVKTRYEKTPRNIAFSAFVIGCAVLVFSSVLYVAAGDRLSSAVNPAFQTFRESVRGTFSIASNPTFQTLGDTLERWLAPEIVYQRPQEWDANI